MEELNTSHNAYDFNKQKLKILVFQLMSHSACFVSEESCFFNLYLENKAFISSFY